MTVHVCVDCACVWRLHNCTCVWRLHDFTRVWRLHDCTCVCGGYMTVHVCVEAT